MTFICDVISTLEQCNVWWIWWIFRFNPIGNSRNKLFDVSMSYLICFYRERLDFFSKTCFYMFCDMEIMNILCFSLLIMASLHWIQLYIGSLKHNVLCFTGFFFCFWFTFIVNLCRHFFCDFRKKCARPKWISVWR